MTDDITPWLARLAGDADPRGFAHAAAGLRAFLLYTALHDQAFEPTAAQRDELTALYQSLAERDGVESRSVESVRALCASLRLADDLRTSSVSRSTQFSAWLAFAQATYDEGDPAVALSVVRRVALDAETDDAIALAARARLLEGFLYIRGGDLAGAEHVLLYAERLARAVGEQSIVLRSRLGRANILWMRGNLPRAEAELTSLIRTARGAAYDVLPTMLLVRGSVAHARGKYEDAVVWALRSFEASDDIRQQVRALTDLASFLTEFPDSFLAGTARRALEYVTEHGPEQSGRDHAAVNLLGFALDRGDITEFRRWIAHLAPRDLRPRHSVLYGLYRAKGARLFALNDDRDLWLQLAEQTAQTHGFAQLSFEIEAEVTASPLKATSDTVSNSAAARAAELSAGPNAPVARVPRRVRRVAETVNVFLDAALVA